MLSFIRQSGTASPDPADGRVVAEVLAEYPWDDSLYCLRAESRVERGEYGGSVPDLVAALVLRPERGWYWHQLVVALRGQGHDLAAQAAWRMCQSVEQGWGLL